MTEDMKSTVILCADDFGISAGVNRAIVDLAAQGHLSAVSCMSCGEAWAEGAKALKEANADIDVGLHLTFTYLVPLTKEWATKEKDGRFPSEKALILKSWLRLLDKELVEKEIRAQFAKFIEVWGAPPDFIDGHQHVHVLPVIREALLKVRAALAPQSWIRNVVDFSVLKESKKYAILAVLGLRFLELLNENHIVHNKYFRGAYDFFKPADFSALMARWRAVGAPVLIYCHPGFPDAGLAKFDAVIAPRRREYDFFNGAQFRAWLQEGSIVLQKRPHSGVTKLFQLTNQIRRFIITGSINTAFSYIIYVAAVLFLNMTYYWAVTFSWCLGVTFSYLMFRAFVFTGGDRSWKSFRKFLPTYVILLIFNEAALFMLVHALDWNKLIAQAVLLPVIAALSFILNRLFIFK